MINLMAKVKAWTENIMPISFNSTIEMAISLLEKEIEVLDEDDEEHRKISFIIEQLHLLTKRKFGRQYSPQLTILNLILYNLNHNMILRIIVMKMCPSLNIILSVALWQFNS